MQTSRGDVVAATLAKLLPTYCTELVLFWIKFERAHGVMSNNTEHSTRSRGARVATVTAGHGAADAGENNGST